MSKSIWVILLAMLLPCLSAATADASCWYPSTCLCLSGDSVIRIERAAANDWVVRDIVRATDSCPGPQEGAMVDFSHEGDDSELLVSMPYENGEDVPDPEYLVLGYPEDDRATCSDAAQSLSRDDAVRINALDRRSCEAELMKLKPFGPCCDHGNCEENDTACSTVPLNVHAVSSPAWFAAVLLGFLFRRRRENRF